MMSFSRWLGGTAISCAVLLSIAIPAHAQVPQLPAEGAATPAPADAAHGADTKTPVPMSPEARPAPYDPKAFGADPDYADKPYSRDAQLEIYGGKTKVDGPRPPVELGYPLYQEGDIGRGINIFGEKNLSRPQLLVFGDWRTAVAFNDNGKKENALVATRLNVDVDLRLTSTERIHAFFRPLDRRGVFTNYTFAGDDPRSDGLRLDGNIETLFFEGDVGSLLAGFTDEYNSVDVPFTFGKFPLLFQNGVWMEDAIIGAAASLPSLNSARLDISNMDFTFFYAGDDASTPALKDPSGNLALHAGHVYGIAAFADMLQGYVEAGYGYVDDTRPHSGFGYHNITASLTRRYGGWLSNSMRVIVNVGQDPEGHARQTADGFVLLVENSLITALPSTFIPYGNFFWGQDRPQSLLRDAGAGGVLKNTGINFETDGLTGFPKLDDTANNTWGGAIGLEYLFGLDQQIVGEVATVQTVGPDLQAGRAAKGNQYALGLRYQVPITDRWIIRVDGIVADRESDADLAGAKVEFRWKF